MRDIRPSDASSRPPPYLPSPKPSPPLPTLFLAQRFPPHRGAAARRWGWLAERFGAAGPVFVIRRGEEGEEHPAVQRTIHLPARDLRTAVGGGASVSVKKKQHSLVRTLLKMRQAYPFVYLTDDGGPDYRRRAFRLAERLVREEGVTTVVSSFRPWSDHLVAARLKRKYPGLEWLADFRDLPVDPIRQDVWFPGLQRWWGKRVVEGADAVYAVSEGQARQLSSWHSRVEVLRNPLLALPPPANHPSTGHFTIVYTGSLYPGLQSVAPLVKALSTLLRGGRVSTTKLRFCYRGKDADLFREWTAELPGEVLDVGPYIAPAAAQEKQREAQLLLLLNWSAPGYYGVLTAKLWDYLATGRPVLALVNGPDDPELRSIIEGARAGAMFADNQQGLVGWLAEAYERWEEDGTLPWAVDREVLGRYL